MDLQQLRYIVALYQEKNFLKAAKKVNVTQPTLSQQIKKLEQELGVPLFERSTQQVQATEAGKKFLPHAIAMLDTLSKGVAELTDDLDVVRGTVKLAAIPTIAPYILPEVILALKKKAPLVRLEVYEETTSVLLSHLKEGLVDVGILALPVEAPSAVTRKIAKEEFLLAASKRHPLAKKKEVPSSAINTEKILVLQEGHCFGNQTLEYCKRSRSDEQVIFQGSSLTSVLKLAAAGEGVTFVPAMAVEPRFYPGLAFIPFSDPKPFRELAFIWRTTAPLTKASRMVMETAEEVLLGRLQQL